MKAGYVKINMLTARRLEMFLVRHSISQSKVGQFSVSTSAAPSAEEPDI